MRAGTGRRKETSNPFCQFRIEDYVCGLGRSRDSVTSIPLDLPSRNPRGIFTRPITEKRRTVVEGVPDCFPDLRLRLDLARSPERRVRFEKTPREKSRRRNRSRSVRSRSRGPQNQRRSPIRRDGQQEAQEPVAGAFYGGEIQGNRDPAFDRQGVRLRGAQFGGLNPVRQDPSIDPPPRKCFRCWEGEHKQFNCPKKHTIPDHFCYNCGRKWRRVDNCEHCRDVFARHQALKGQLNVSQH